MVPILKLHQLKAFITTVDSGSFSEAGLRLGISQASVSHAISDLEKELGVKLLDRGRFGARATTIGLDITSHARGVLKFTEAIEQEAHLSKGKVHGVLRLTSFRSAAGKIVPKLIAALRKEYPSLNIKIIEIEDSHSPGNTRRRMVREHQVDLAFVSNAPSNEKHLLIWKVMHDVVKVVVPKDDPRTTITWAEIGQEPLILPIGDDVYDTYTRWHLKNLIGEDVEAAFEVKEDTTLINMVSEGLGIGLLPELAIEELPSTVKVISPDIDLERPIYVAILPSSLKVPAVRVFLQALKKRYPDSELPKLT